MTLTKSVNKITGAIFIACLSLMSLYLAEYSLIFMGIIPIAFALIFFNEGLMSAILKAGFTYATALVFLKVGQINRSLIPLFLLGMIFVVLISLKIPAKYQIFLAFVLISLTFIFLFKLEMIENKLTIDKMAAGFKKLIESSYPYRFDLDIYKRVVALYPALISMLAMAYAVVSTKLIRNYLSYKDRGIDDIKDLDQIRMNPKDLLGLGLILALIYFMANFMGIDRLYILANIIFISMLIFVVNGLSLFDYMLKKSSLPLTRAFQWFFMIILFQVIFIPLLFFGFADIFIDFRSRRKNAK